MLAKSLGGKHELPQGRQVLHVPVGFIEGVNDKLPIDRHRLSPLLVAEHDPTAEPPLGSLALRVANGVRPHVGHEDGDFRFRRFVAPGEFVGQIELGTAVNRTQDKQTPGPEKYARHTFMVC